VGLIFSFSNSNFLIVKDRKHCIFPLGGVWGAVGSLHCNGQISFKN
jgi:hypothetical protein